MSTATPTTTDERSRYLLAVLDNAIEVHAEWVKSDIPHITEAFETAFDELAEVFRVGDIPHSCRQLVQEVAALTQHWETWKNNPRDRVGNAVLPSPSFWHAFETTQKARHAATRRPPRKMETIEEFTKQGVSDRQICMNYGFMHGKDDPNYDMLREEREKPGTHLGPDWVTPAEKEWRAEEANRQAIIDRVLAKQQSKLQQLEDANTPAESLEDLIRQDVSAEQIMRMTGWDRERLEHECDQQGFAVPQANYADPRTARAPHEQPIPDEVHRAMGGTQPEVAPPPPGPMPEELRIKPESGPSISSSSSEAISVEKHIVNTATGPQGEGLNTRTLADLVSKERGEHVTWQKVSRVLKKYERDPGAIK
jgi:hypothetical protein